MINIVISDLHGESFKEQYNKILDLDIEFNNIILLGDYFHSYNRSVNGKYQLRHFEEMIDISKRDKRVIMLIGNHDIMHLIGHRPAVTMFPAEVSRKIKELIEENLKLFRVVWKGDKYVYSHAGVSKTFMRNNNLNTLEEINEIFWNKEYKRFEVYDNAELRDWEKYTPTVMRFEVLCNDYWCENQVVGHTELPFIQIKKGKIIGIETFSHNNIIMIDESE